MHFIAAITQLTPTQSTPLKVHPERVKVEGNDLLRVLKIKTDTYQN